MYEIETIPQQKFSPIDGFPLTKSKHTTVAEQARRMVTGIHDKEFQLFQALMLLSIYRSNLCARSRGTTVNPL